MQVAAATNNVTCSNCQNLCTRVRIIPIFDGRKSRIVYKKYYDHEKYHEGCLDPANPSHCYAVESVYKKKFCCKNCLYEMMTMDYGGKQNGKQDDNKRISKKVNSLKKRTLAARDKLALLKNGKMNAIVPGYYMQRKEQNRDNYAKGKNERKIHHNESCHQQERMIAVMKLKSKLKDYADNVKRALLKLPRPKIKGFLALYKPLSRILKIPSLFQTNS